MVQPRREGDDAWGPRFRLSGRAALWLPVVVSFAVQVPATLWLAWRAGLFGPVAATGIGRGPGAGPAGDGAFGWQGGMLGGGDVGEHPGIWAARSALALAGPVALLFARRHPGAVVAVVTALAGAYAIVVAGSVAPPYLALAFAVVGAVVRGARTTTVWSLVAGWTATLGIGLLLGVPWQIAPVTAVTLALVLLVVLGSSIRNRRARFDEARRRAAERRANAVQAERVRIARELHDVLAHSLSQINVQAGVGLHLSERDPEHGRAALANIKAASKTALDEVRSVLGMLRDDSPAGTAPLGPEPGPAQLGALADGVRAQGVAVQLSIDPSASSAATQAAQLAVYRIVQESLTNVLRHASATSARVRVAVEGRMLVVQIDDDGPSGAARLDAGSRAPGDPAGPREPGQQGGRGLVGMRERAELLGGRFEAGARPDGGFTVRAELPLPGGPASTDGDRA